MEILTSKQIRDMDRLAFELYNIPTIILMENAAISVVNEILKKIDNMENPKVNIFAGKGNNGGDGFAIARHLFQKNIEVNIFVTDVENLKGDALINFNIVKALGIPVKQIFELEELQNITEADVNVDCLLGTGIKGEVRGITKDIIEFLNIHSKYTLSVDIPSGIDADCGKVCGNAVRANKTVTFAYVKQGLILNPAIEYVGELVVTDIGLPGNLLKELDIKAYMIDDFEFSKRKSRTHKGTYGKLMAFAGSADTAGAAFLLSKAAYKTGAGLVELCSIPKVISEVRVNLPEIVGTGLSEIDGKIADFEPVKEKLKSASAVAAGSGLGISQAVREFIENLLYYCEVPVVLDADALNILSDMPQILKSAKAPVIITPHPKEMSRLTDYSVSEILDNTLEIAREFSSKYNVITLLKDNRSIIANPKGEIYINTSGCPAMAKAGSGDVLTGIIGGLLAQKIEPFKAATIGAYLHGKAGEKAASVYGEYGVMASEMVGFIL